jgi:hypothetical protein
MAQFSWAQESMHGFPVSDGFNGMVSSPLVWIAINSRCLQTAPSSPVQCRRGSCHGDSGLNHDFRGHLKLYLSSVTTAGTVHQPGPNMSQRPGLVVGYSSLFGPCAVNKLLAQQATARSIWTAKFKLKEKSNIKVNATELEITYFCCLLRNGQLQLSSQSLLHVAALCWYHEINHVN